MFFTQEDYRKIEKWLLANSRKDTDFVGAATPLKGNETVVLVQNGKNVKTSVKDIVDQFFLLGVSDFLNITDKYGESYISLTQAIQLIPFRSRKEGQVITFIDESGNWAIYQFQGKALNQWNNPTLWIDLLAKVSGIPIVDSEDITTKENGAKQVSLYLADKQYNEADYSGLGRIYLRKSIVEIDDPIYGKVTKNILFQDMIAQANTIYEIRYDYSLNGNTVTIPEGCILDMRGGSVTNGTINCVDTIIISTDASKLDVTLTGTYRFDSEKLVTSNTEDINITQSVDRKSHTISAMLADRDTTNGMGYVILRKDKTFAEQVTQENTIYEIRYDFNLNGTEITIPEGCVLDFQGGSLSGGTIIGQGTMFEKLTPNCLLVDFDGFFYDSVIKVSSIGLLPLGDGTVSGTPNQHAIFDRLNNLIKCTKNIEVVFERGFYGFGGESMEKTIYANANRLFYGYYAISVSNNVTESVKITGNGCEFVNVFPYHMGFWADNGNGLVPTDNLNGANYTYQGHSYKYGNEGGGFFFANHTNGRKVDFYFEDFTVDMHSEIMLYGGNTAATASQINIEIRGTSGNVIAKNIISKNAVCDCFRVGGTISNSSIPENVYLQQCKFINGVRNCVALSGGYNIVVDGCVFKDAGQIFDTQGGLYKFEDPWSSLDIEPARNYSYVRDIVIRNCEFKDSNNSYIVSSPSNDLDNITIIGCTVETTKKRKNYDSGNHVVEIDTVPGFFNVFAKVSATADDISLTNTPFGHIDVFHIPIEERPDDFDETDTSKEYIYTQCFGRKVSNIGNVVINTKEGNLNGMGVGLPNCDYLNYKLSYSNGSWKWSAISSGYDSATAMHIANMYICLVKTFVLTKSTYNYRGFTAIDNFVLELTAPCNNTVLSVNQFNYYITNFTVIDKNEDEAGTGYLLSIGAQSAFTADRVSNFSYLKNNGTNYAVLGGPEVKNNPNVLWLNSERDRNTPLYGSRLFIANNSRQETFLGSLPAIKTGETIESTFNKTSFIIEPNLMNALYATDNRTTLFTWRGRNNTTSNFTKRYVGMFKNCKLGSVTSLNDVKVDADVVVGGLNPGEMIYDKSKKQMIIGTGSGVGNNIVTVRYDGENYTIKTHGTFAEKPIPTNIGFQYFNEDTHRMITWDGSKWWNPDGTEATS